MLYRTPRGPFGVVQLTLAQTQPQCSRMELHRSCCRYGNLMVRSKDGTHYPGHRYSHMSLTPRRLGTTQVGSRKYGNRGGYVVVRKVSKENYLIEYFGDAVCGLRQYCVGISVTGFKKQTSFYVQLTSPNESV